MGFFQNLLNCTPMVEKRLEMSPVHRVMLGQLSWTPSSTESFSQLRCGHSDVGNLAGRVSLNFAECASFGCVSKNMDTQEQVPKDPVAVLILAPTLLKPT